MRPRPDRRLHLGVQLPEVERPVGWSEYVAMAQAAEAAGLDSIWLGDHLLYRGDGREERGPWDAWILLAALAAVTERVELGPLVACTAFVPPVILARHAAALSEVSGGRFVLALGAGWNETEFRAAGMPFDRRAARFEEAFHVIRRLLAGERVTLAGSFIALEDAVVLPRPAVRPRLMVGTTGERVLRATLLHVDAWNIWYDWYGNSVEGFARENARIDALVGAAGREPGDVARSATVFVAFDGTSGNRPHATESTVGPDPGAIVEHVLGLHAEGLDEAIFVLSPIDQPAIERLAGVVAEVAAATG